jgi:outer membrane receptor protein involved in Fe transport
MKSKSFQQQVSVAATVAAILGGVAFAGYAPGARAQEAGGEITEVVVTGSRIVRKDLTSNSPLVTVDTAALEQRSGLNIESYLNQLPSFNPAAAPTILNGPGSNSDVQISAVSSVGISAVSLRGLGPNRTLTLIDGRRSVPVNALMVVDVNSIPSSMIKRVEIISGGASAVYGADAMGGVSNFILRKDFEGLEVDTQYGGAEAGDNQEIRASGIMGTKIADGKGHIVVATEYYDRQAAYQKNRDFFTKGWQDPTVQGNFLNFVFGENGYNSVLNAPAPSAVTKLAGNPACASPGSCAFTGFRFNPDGSIFFPTGNNMASFKKPIDGLVYSTYMGYDTTKLNSTNPAPGPGGVPVDGNPDGLIPFVKYNEVEGYASSPQTRYALMATGEFDVTDHVKFFSDARYAQSRTTTFLAGTNASYGWETTIPYAPATDSPFLLNDPTTGALLDYGLASTIDRARAGQLNNPGFIAHGAAGAQHPVTPDLALLLNSRGRQVWCQTGAPGCAATLPGGAVNPNATADSTLVGKLRTVTEAQRSAGWVAETYPLDSFGRRATTDEVQSFQIETGFRFDLPVKDWTGEVYYSRGESTTYNVAQGNNSLARWRAVTQAPDYGLNSKLQSNSNGASPNFGSVPVPCTTGFYDTLLKGDARPSDDCIYAVAAALQTRTENQQDVVEFNTQGGLFNLPAGELRAAAGYQFRRNSAQFNPDILQSTASLNDQVIGVYPTGYLDASTAVKDIYTELLVPVIGGFDWLKRVELDLGARKSDYNKTKDTFTWKANATIEINDALMFRGGFNRATRAPNLGEMFLNLQQVFGAGGTFGDPCYYLSNSPFGAGGAIATNPLGGATPTLASGQTAAGARSTYLICQAQMGAAGANYFYGPTLNPAPTATGGGFAWNNQIGNPNLRSETANTTTVGFVLQSPFESALLKSMSFTVDYYRIKMKDVIEPYSVDYARYLCYGTEIVGDAAAAAARAASPECQAVPRSTSTGGALTQLLTYSNQATVDTAGIDFSMNWFGNFGDMGLQSIPGGIGLNIQGTYLDKYVTKLSPTAFDVPIDWKGSLGPNVPGFNSGAYDYRLFTSLSYTLPTMNFSLRWRFLPAVDHIQQATEKAILKNNYAVQNGAGGTILSYTPTQLQGTPSYSQFDLSFNWNINDTYSVRAGVDNLLDKDPPIAGTTTTTGKNLGYSTADWDLAKLNALCAGKPGCQIPTAYTVPTSGQGTTSGGYYDTLGRRYYIGVKASF